MDCFNRQIGCSGWWFAIPQNPNEKDFYQGKWEDGRAPRKEAPSMFLSDLDSLSVVIQYGLFES